MKYVLFISFFSIFFVAQPVHAVQFSFSQSPQEYQVIAKPEATVVLPFTLTNISDPTVMKLQVYALSIQDSQGSYKLIPDYSDNPNSIHFDLNNSLHTLDEPFFMNTSEAIEYEIAVHIPKNIKEGDYYYAIVGQTEQNSGYVDTNTIFFQGGIGSIIYLTVNTKGVLSQSGNIAQFGVQSKHSITWRNKEYKLFDSFEYVPFVLSIANTGANVLQAEGSISIRPQFLRSDSRLIIIDSTYVLSETNKTLISSKSLDRNNTAMVRAPFLGVFTAQAVVRIDSTANTLLADILYIVFPFTYVVYGVGMFLIIATIMVYVRRIKGKESM